MKCDIYLEIFSKKIEESTLFKLISSPTGQAVQFHSVYEHFILSGERYPTNAQGCCKQFFIVLIKLPRHVSASKYHLQGVKLSLFIRYSSFVYKAE
jgi:hypothetical protein